MAQQQSTWQNGVRYAARSDVGLRRSNNQDSYGVLLASSQNLWESRGHLFVVADGMGAHAAGELASKLATDTILQAYRKLTDLAPPDAILAAVEEANHVIHGRGEANAEFHGMGTTASVLLLLPQGALVAHVGDSRVYRLRGNQLDQLTYDHSLVWEMMSSGNLNPDQVPPYLPKNIITRSCGPSAKVEVDREGPFPLADGDTFLLCSDGLSGQVSDEEIGQILMTLGPEEAADSLVDLANLRGGPDNITVIVVQVAGRQLFQESPEGWVLPQSSRSSVATRLIFAVLAGALFLLAMILAACQIWIAAGPAALAALVFCAMAIIGGPRSTANQHVDSVVGRYGRGPHRTRTCLPDRAFTSRLAEIDQQLRQATADEGWNIDWNQFGQLELKAQAATNRHDFAEAVRCYCQAISFVMNQLRNQRNKQAGAGI